MVATGAQGLEGFVSKLTDGLAESVSHEGVAATDALSVGAGRPPVAPLHMGGSHGTDAPKPTVGQQAAILERWRRIKELAVTEAAASRAIDAR